MRRFAFCLALTLTPALALSADWPMFRGADRSGVSKDKNLLAKWPDDGPPVVWKSPDLGFGFSSVSVFGDQVFTMGDVGKDCFVYALDRKKGEKQWQLRVGPAGGGGGYPGPRCTPSTDGTHVYALGHAGDLVCVSAKDGKEVWRKNLKTDFKGRSGGWSYTESPLIDGDNLIVTPGGPKAAVVALNKKTGEVVWSGEIPGDDSAGYSSVVIGNCGGTKQYITLMANGLVSFDAKTGKMLWRYGATGERYQRNTANIPTPIVQGDHVFASTGYGRGAALVKITKKGDTFDVEEVYWNRALTNKHGGVIYVDGKLYGDRDDGGQIWCADFLTGKVLWTRKGGNGGGSASVTYADGKLYVRYADGWVALVDAKADKYVEISSFKVPNARGNCWAHPVVVDGKFYVRERETVFCHDVSAK